MSMPFRQQAVYAVLLALLVACMCVAMCGCQSSKKQREKDKAIAREADNRFNWISTSLAVSSQALTSAEQVVDELILEEKDPVRKAKLMYIRKDVRIGHDGLKKADVDLTKQKVAFAATVTRAEKAETDLEKPLTAKLNAAIILGLFVSVAGAVAGGVGSRLGAGMSPKIAGMLSSGYDVAMGGVLLVVGAMSVRFIGPYGWIAGIFATVVACGMIGFYAWRAVRRQQLYDDRERLQSGFMRVVATEERVRDRDDVPTEAVVEEATKMQDEDTKRLVREVRSLPEFKELVANGRAA